MYYPYFRGKQFELLTIREQAVLLAQSKFVPIIEPVREGMGGLERALQAVCKENGHAIVVINPNYGDHVENNESIFGLLKKSFNDQKIFAGILLSNQMNAQKAFELYSEHQKYQPVFIHQGFTEAKLLVDQLGNDLGQTTHIFVEKFCQTLYRKHFKDCKERILLRDGFQRKRNADYTDIAEKFSELHITYQDEGMNGFGDFLTVGDDYSEGGGPAYAVAIHLTFIDSDQDDVMYIHHFVSTTNNTPTDPAGKFGQALDKLIKLLNSKNSKLFGGDAIHEFKTLHEKQHFPGLGYVKKLSLTHHIETLADYFRPAQ
jgi:hypothetical protein